MKHVKLFSILAIASLLITACGATPTSEPPTEVAVQATEASPAEPTNEPAPAPTEEPTEAPTEAPPEPEGPRIFKYAYTSGPTTWDPSASFSTEPIYIHNMYETLLTVNAPGSEELCTPVLAESWEHSDDGLTWTFHIREGVTFQDGAELNADAVVKSISRTITLGRGASFIWGAVASLEAPDPMTVVFNLSYAVPLELIVGATYAAWITSPNAVDAAAEDPEYFEQGPGLDAGTGPYKLESYTPGKEAVLTKFDGYWQGWDDAPHSDKVIIYIVPDEVTRQQMLFGGEVDHASLLPIETIMRLKDDPDYTFYQVLSPYNYLAYLNTQKPPLDNKLVRQAIAYAMPYDDILDGGRVLWLWLAIAQPRAQGHLAILGRGLSVHLRSRQGKGSDGGGWPGRSNL